MKKRILIAAVLTVIAFFSYLTFTSMNTKTGVAVASKKTYTGTLYVSGHGGHFAKADVTIDPNNAEEPVKVNNLDRIVIGDKTTHQTHDPRIDADNKDLMFWSTYKLDPGNKVHVGKSDLKTGNVIKDVAIDIDARTKGPAPLYCGSGQTKNSYIPVVMAGEAYIDVFDKKDLQHKHRVFLNELGYKPGGYKFFHGTNTPDMKSFVVAINLAEGGNPNGKIDILMLDLKELENGKVKLLAKNTITGEPGKTITFREFYTKDGKYLLQSGGDRMFLLDAKTLKLIDEEMMSAGENHDVMPTPDGKYAIVTLRAPVNVGIEEGSKTITDGTLQVYDMDTKKLVGKSVSVCVACHGKMEIKETSILCGLDGNLK
ncbi:MAG: hypothetical protein HZA16_09605 [Nitrospirae bacterium]|nr:hypothetical protein [Nitrospirota bacterium]